MEENRLKEMVPNYDHQMFNRLYNKTEGLRKKLASGIDPHRFGLQTDDILSWFDVKFIYVFNNYCQQYSEDILLGYLINSLTMFKNRILRGAYTHKFSQKIVEADSITSLENELTDYQPIERNSNHYYDLFIKFMREQLSANALTLLEVQLNPPGYILNRINEMENVTVQKIPDELYLEYFNLGFSDKAYKFIASLKKEIRNAVNYAKLHFKNSPTVSL